MTLFSALYDIMSNKIYDTLFSALYDIMSNKIYGTLFSALYDITMNYDDTPFKVCNRYDWNLKEGDAHPQLGA